MPVLDNYMSVVEASEVLGVHWETVKRLCREGRIPATKIHNMWLINKNDLEKFALTYNEPHRGKRKK
jgi:excisionase family DNA binding protein